MNNVRASICAVVQLRTSVGLYPVLWQCSDEGNVNTACKMPRLSSEMSCTRNGEGRTRSHFNDDCRFYEGA